MTPDLQELSNVSTLLSERLRMATPHEASPDNVAQALLTQAGGYVDIATENGAAYLLGKRAIIGLTMELTVLLEIEYENRGI